MFSSMPLREESAFSPTDISVQHVRFLVFCAIIVLSGSAYAVDAGFPGRNVNIVGPPPIGSGQPQDVGLRQQNEPSCAVNPANSLQICCGYNDYRGIDIPLMGDAWEGLSCSRDGGKSWHSQLIPGHGADSVHNLNLEFAADPNLVSVPGGLFFNFIAADRGHVGGIYVQQFAWRNKEDGWPLTQVGGPILISKGTNGRFIDKPHMIGFLDDDSTSTISMSWVDANGTATRTLPAGNLGMAAAVFVGNDNNDGTKILYWNSDDWGKTWGHGTKLTESKGVNSGINLAANGDTVCAVWRRFDDTNETSSVLHACSSNRGKTFTKPKLIADICPFDQVTLNGTAVDDKDVVSFRTNAFPVIAADGSNFYAFWSDRGFAAASDFEQGCNLRDANNGFNPSFGRIVYSRSTNGGKTWSAPKVIEDVPSGHQFMPAAFGANGEVVVSWIDNRDDIANFLDIDKQLIVDIWKADDALYRHTTDIRSARLIKGGNASFTDSVKVSRYTTGLVPSGLKQLEYNLVNARLFQQGTAPFIGDYLSVTAKAANKNADGKWVNSNTEPVTGPPTFHISWGDNRDVRGNAWGTADTEGFSGPSPYTPSDPNSVNAQATTTVTSNATPAVEDPPDNQQIYCDAATVKADRTRDQNVYSAPLYPLAVMRSPGAVKITGQVQRALPVYLENYSSQARYFQLQISGTSVNQAPGCAAIASFRQLSTGSGGCGQVSSIFVKVYPKSTAVRTVFQTSTDQTLHGIEVSASDCGSNTTGCALVASIVLNQDPLELGGNLEQPDFDSFNSILTQELHNPDLLNPDLLNPDLLNILLQNPGLLNSDLLNPDLLNPDLLNPDLLNLIIANPDLLNPDLLNTMILNPDLLNPDLLNVVAANPDLLNIIVANPDLLNPDLLNLLIANPNPSNTDLENLSLANPDLLNQDLLNLMIANPDLLNPDLLNMELLNPDLLNPDLLNPDLLNIMVANPDLLNPDLLNPDLLNLDLANPDLLNPDLLNPDLLNPDLLNPDLLNPDLLNLILLNPDLLNPDLLNPDLLNPDLLNPDLLNPDLLNLLVSNPDLLNPDLLNPDLLNPDLLNPDLLNAVVSYSDLENPDVANADLANNANDSYIDVTWQVKNDGNTTTGYMAQPYIAGPTEHTATQLIVSKPYLRQTTRDCLPVLESANQVVVNIYNPPIQEPIINPNPEEAAVYGLASYWLAPGEVANVTLRIFADDPASLHAGRVGLYSNSQACNSNEACADQPFVITTRQADYDGPVLTPDFITSIGDVEATGPDGAIVTFSVPTAFDEGDGEAIPVECDLNSGSVFPIGTTSNSCGASDSAGNESVASFTVEVQDGTAPDITITIPEDFDMPVEATSAAGALIGFDAWIAVTDLVDPLPSVDCVPASGTQFPTGTTSVTCTATDQTGNTSVGNFDVSVADTTVPVLNLPADISVEADGAAGTLVTFIANADDIVDGSITADCTPTSGSTFVIGMTPVTCNATDTAGNTASGIFNVSVADTTAPSLVVPASFTLEAVSPLGNVVSYTVSVSDDVDNDIFLACAPASGSTFLIGSTTVGCLASDDFGNESGASFVIQVADTTMPTVLMPDPITLEAIGPAGASVTYTVTANDVADASLDISCTPLSGSVLPLGVTTITCTATDDSGNVGNGSVTATITDTTPPILTVPDGLFVSAQSDTGSIVDYVTSATDTVDISVEVVCAPASGTEFGNGETLVTCTATDDGFPTVNVTTATFTVFVRKDIIWVTPIDDPHSALLGPNLNLRWGYGVDGVLQDSGDMIDKPPGKGTDPIVIKYLGLDCVAGNPRVVDLDAGKSSLRYSSSEWQLNWQTGQSMLDGSSLVPGCYLVEVPRAPGNGGADTKQIILD